MQNLKIQEVVLDLTTCREVQDWIFKSDVSNSFTYAIKESAINIVKYLLTYPIISQYLQEHASAVVISILKLKNYEMLQLLLKYEDVRNAADASIIKLYRHVDAGKQRLIERAIATYILEICISSQMSNNIQINLNTISSMNWARQLIKEKFKDVNQIELMVLGGILKIEWLRSKLKENIPSITIFTPLLDTLIGSNASIAMDVEEEKFIYPHFP